MHCGHKVCIFFVWPQTGHLFKLFTSLSALPAICRCRFFICEVLLLGTALRMPSQISPSRPGMLWMAAGIAIASDGHVGYGDCRVCCEKRTADLMEEANVVEVIRGSSDDTTEANRNCCMVAMVSELNAPPSTGSANFACGASFLVIGVEWGAIDVGARDFGGCCLLMAPREGVGERGFRLPYFALGSSVAPSGQSNLGPPLRKSKKKFPAQLGKAHSMQINSSGDCYP